MFDTKQILKMMGVEPELFNQLMAIQAMLNKLPKEKQTEIVTNFVNELQSAVKETDNGSNI